MTGKLLVMLRIVVDQVILINDNSRYSPWLRS